MYRQQQKIMKNQQILELVRCNDDLKEGYESFKNSRYSDYRIVDMEALYHFNGNVCEVNIHFIYCDRQEWIYEYYRIDEEIKCRIRKA